MKQEYKVLLLGYLSMAVPYEVKMQTPYENHPVELCGIILDDELIRFYRTKLKGFIMTCNKHLTYYETLQFKPFLRSMPSMTKEEVMEFNNIPSTKNYQIVNGDLPWDVANYKQIQWLLKKHFDFMGLIPEGLAIEVTEENNPYNITEE